MTDHNPRVVELMGGPLDGLTHEVAMDWPCPSQMGLPDPHDNNKQHWYTYFGDAKFKYVRSETIK